MVVQNHWTTTSTADVHAVNFSWVPPPTLTEEVDSLIGLLLKLQRGDSEDFDLALKDFALMRVKVNRRKEEAIRCERTMELAHRLLVKVRNGRAA